MNHITAQKNLKFVILDCPIDHWENPVVKGLFQKLIGLKLKGYRSRYGSAVLPIETVDFVATHVLVCEETPEGLVPLMGNRCLTTERCKRFNMKFPLVSLLEECESPEHAKAVEEYIHHTSKNSRYFGSWTGDPELSQTNPEFFKELFHMFYASQVYACPNAENEEIFTCGNLVLKTERHIKFLGYEEFKKNGENLPPFSAFFISNHPSVIFKTSKGYSDLAKQDADKYKLLWQNRIIVSSSDEFNDAIPVRLPQAS